MKILHVSAGWEPWNGAANIARLIGGEQEKAGHDVTCRVWAGIGELRNADEVWIHCSWSPCLWWAALWGRHVRWVPEGSYDPVRLQYHAWKKWLVAPIERFFLRRAERVVATCKAEAEWIKAFEPRVKNVETIDVKRFFKLPPEGGACTIEEFQSHVPSRRRLVHLLYMGRNHPLKGLEYLERALREVSPEAAPRFDFRMANDFTGMRKQLVWKWCELLVLPTLSDNFGLVVAEALSMGNSVLTTDGAVAWCENLVPVSENLSVGYGGRLLLVRNFRDASHPRRVELLVEALNGVLKNP